MNLVRQFTFETTLPRNNGCREVDTIVKVTAVADYQPGQGNGLGLRILSTEHAGMPLSDDELDELHNRALDQATQF